MSPYFFNSHEHSNMGSSMNVHGDATSNNILESYPLKTNLVLYNNSCIGPFLRYVNEGDKEYQQPIDEVKHF